MNRSLICLFAIGFWVDSTAQGQQRVASKVGGNEIVVTSYSPRDLTTDDSPIESLKERWDTRREIRWDLASLLAVLSEQVYNDDDETLDYLLRGMGFDRWVAIRNKTMAAHVLSRDRLAVVVFRGTNFTEIPDWYRNLRADFDESPRGRFHHGFHRAYHDVRPEVLRFLETQKPTTLWVTGHSLGGAMAVACGVDLRLNTELKATLVTFGQPRYADERGARWIDQQYAGRYMRFVHGADIVPSVPFYVPRFFPYAHAGNLVAMEAGEVIASQSTLTVSGLTANYCGSCGRTTMSFREPTYQAPEEPPTLTQEEYEQSLRRSNVVAIQPGRNGFGGLSETQAQYTLIPGYFSDHSVAKYRQGVRRNRDR